MRQCQECGKKIGVKQGWVCVTCRSWAKRPVVHHGPIRAGDVLEGPNGFVWDRAEDGGIVLYMAPPVGVAMDDPPTLRTMTEERVRKIGIREPNPCGTLVCPAILGGE